MPFPRISLREFAPCSTSRHETDKEHPKKNFDDDDTKMIYDLI